MKITYSLETQQEETDSGYIASYYVDNQVVPSSITRVQAMKQMKVLGLWETFKTVLASNEDAQDEWDLATALYREHEFVSMLAPALGMSEEDIDNLFIEASKI